MIDDPSVYPHNELNHDGTIFQQHAGISLRDAAAIRMAAAIAPSRGTITVSAAGFDRVAGDIAQTAYAMADRMLAARSQVSA